MDFSPGPGMQPIGPRTVPDERVGRGSPWATREKTADGKQSKEPAGEPRPPRDECVASAAGGAEERKLKGRKRKKRGRSKSESLYPASMIECAGICLEGTGVREVGASRHEGEEDKT